MHRFTEISFKHYRQARVVSKWLVVPDHPVDSHGQVVSCQHLYVYWPAYTDQKPRTQLQGKWSQWFIPNCTKRPTLWTAMGSVFNVKINGVLKGSKVMSLINR